MIFLTNENYSLNATIDQPEDEWVTVKGYKGVSQDLKGCGGFRYEIGKTFSIENPENLSICSHGFHFCLNLKDVFKYFPIDSIKHYRYFKVEGVVRRKDYNDYGKNNLISSFDKLVAKEITLIEEVSEQELYEASKQKLFYWDYEEFALFRASDEDYCTFVSKSRENILINKGYSPFFVKILIKNALGVCKNYNKLTNITTEAIGLMDEKVGPDMRAYLLLKGD